jgi:hypothetical protein
MASHARCIFTPVGVKFDGIFQQKHADVSKSTHTPGYFLSPHPSPQDTTPVFFGHVGRTTNGLDVRVLMSTVVAVVVGVGRWGQ